MIFRYFDVLSITSYIRKKCDFDHFCEGADLQLYFKKNKIDQRYFKYLDFCKLLSPIKNVRLEIFLYVRICNPGCIALNFIYSKKFKSTNDMKT